MQVDLSGIGISYKRQKISSRAVNRIHIGIQPEARTIINRYIGDDGRLHLGYRYTGKNLQCYINQCLKLLAKEIGISGVFSFYSARKSFAQMANEIGVLRYYTKIRQKQADIAIQRVIDYAIHPEVYKDYVDMRMNFMMMMTT